MNLKRKCWLASDRYTSVFLACTSVVCLLMTVAEFILLFSTVTFHICIYFPVEMVFRLQRLFFWCCSASLSLSRSLFPSSLLQHSFAMPFHPLASHCRAPVEPFKSAFLSPLSKVHKPLDLACLKRAKNWLRMPQLGEAALIVMSVCLMKYTTWILVPEADPMLSGTHWLIWLIESQREVQPI